MEAGLAEVTILIFLVYHMIRSAKLARLRVASVANVLHLPGPLVLLNQPVQEPPADPADCDGIVRQQIQRHVKLVDEMVFFLQEEVDQVQREWSG